MLSDLLRCACDLCVLNCAPDFFLCRGRSWVLRSVFFSGENEIRYILIVTRVEFVELRRWHWFWRILSRSPLTTYDQFVDVIGLLTKEMKILEIINKISVQYIFTSFWSGKWFVWPGEGEKKMHDSLIWRKEKREKGRKRETSGSNQGAVSSKRRRIVKEIKSKMRKKRMKKHRWIG